MSTMYITEFSDPGPLDIFASIEPSNGDQNISFTATPGTSAAFKNNTRVVRINCDGVASLAFGTNPTAAITNRRISAGVTEKFIIPVGQAYKVSAITNT